MMRPMATKKIGVEIAAAFAEMIPHANIAARTSASAAMSMAPFHPFSPATADYLNIDPMQLRPSLQTWGLAGKYILPSTWLRPWGLWTCEQALARNCVDWLSA